VTRLHRRIDAIDIDDAVPIIEGHVNAPEMSFLLKDPRRHVVELLIRPVTDQLLRQIPTNYRYEYSGSTTQKSGQTVIKQSRHIGRSGSHEAGRCRQERAVHGASTKD
jgi:hypothetical protein